MRCCASAPATWCAGNRSAPRVHNHPDAAAIMAEQGVSALLIMDSDRLTGIITDRDLRSRVLAVGLEPARPVSDVMTPDPITASPDALAFELMLAMVERTIHHLPLVADGHPVGVVTSTDLLRLEHANPVYLVGDVAKQEDVTGLAAVCRRLPGAVERLVGQDASADDIGRVVTAVGDAVERRLIALAERRLGPPPVPYCWVTLGSRARMEQALAADQDHALVLHDDATERTPRGSRTWPGWSPTGSRSGLPAVPRRRHGRQCGGACRSAMAAAVHVVADRADARRRRCGPASSSTCDRWPGTCPCTPGWRRTCASGRGPRRCSCCTWPSGPPPTSPPRLLPRPRGGAKRRAPRHARHQVGRYRRRRRAGARSRARGGCPEVGTRARLTAAAADGRLEKERAHDLQDAFEFVSYLRLRHQAQQVRAGQEPDNHLAPALSAGPTSGTCATRSASSAARRRRCCAATRCTTSPDRACCADPLSSDRAAGPSSGGARSAARRAGRAAAGRGRRHRPAAPARGRHRDDRPGRRPRPGAVDRLGSRRRRGVVLAGARYRVVRPEGGDRVGRARPCTGSPTTRSRPGSRWPTPSPSCWPTWRVASCSCTSRGSRPSSSGARASGCGAPGCPGRSSTRSSWSTASSRPPGSPIRRRCTSTVGGAGALRPAPHRPAPRPHRRRRVRRALPRPDRRARGRPSPTAATPARPLTQTVS